MPLGGNILITVYAIKNAKLLHKLSFKIHPIEN
jgi:hypothetical protein